MRGMQGLVLHHENGDLTSISPSESREGEALG